MRINEQFFSLKHKDNENNDSAKKLDQVFLINYFYKYMLKFLKDDFKK